jgi:UDP-3-O-[3-hydroxymyristoyl] glucosamine N-acyltransferase
VSTTLRQLAELVRGELHGDGDLEITAALPRSDAGPRHITFLEQDRRAGLLASCNASAAIVPATLANPPLPAIRVADPLGAFIAVVQHLTPPAPAAAPGIDARASVHPTAQIGPDASIGPFAVVGEGSVLGARCRLYPGAVVGTRCRLGDDVVLHPHAVLYDGTILGSRVIIHANSVIGSDGFGYRFQNGRHVKVPQLGHVEIGDDVEIGAGAAIDRGTFTATRIGAGTKFDNLVHLAHNCQIGRHNLLAGQVGIAGSTTTGDYVMMAGQAGVKDHITIGSGVVVGAQAGVVRDVPAGQRVLGTPAIAEGDQKRVWLTLDKLPAIHRNLRRVLIHLGLDGEETRAAG